MKGNREKNIVRTSIISILANIMLSIFKAMVGYFSHSIAIINDAINNFSDALSSIITIIGTKLANRNADREHPYGHGRIEYMTSLVVSVIVLYAGVTALIESVKKIIHPEDVNYSIYTIIVIVMAIIVKFILGIYVKNRGKKFNSDSLVASGSDAFNDAILSVSVLISIIIFLLFKINIEAYVGILLSIIIIKSGIELIKTSIDNMLGVRIESSLSRNIKKEILKENDVKGVFDLILHDFGPDKYLGSVHIEVPDYLTVADVDKLSRRITKNIMKEYGIILHTIGVYSINTKDKNIENIQKDITNIVFSHEGILEMHGFYLDNDDMSINFDIIIDFKIRDREDLYKHIFNEVQDKYKNYKINVTLDIDISD